ncbi:MAG: MBL fold metallo-hydrolase [Nitrososphaerota archaeon]|nr:MBL fold metallo-hydrolase [Nitrososphaerota archaeon]MDG6990502.1 MBL fold metallo-hydrolase [Nitrososphaerota archaeon]
MPPVISCFGGVGEIGGNKFLLEDRGTKVILDFGTGFADGSDYFDSGIQPRQVNGAGDLFEFGLLPEVPGLYSEKALQNTSMKHSDPEVDAIVLSHYHSDHTGRIGYTDPKIPIYCGETTSLIHDAYSESRSSPLDDHPIRKFRTGRTFKVGPMEFVPVHVDHSIPGAYGFVVHLSDGTMAYTGDFRFHGPAGSMTTDFIEAAAKEEPDLLLTEGTRVGHGDGRANVTEEEVLGEADRMVKGTKGLVFSSFRGNDVDRVNTFYEASKRAGRRLVVSMKMAILLDKLGSDSRLKVPRVGKDVDVYVKRKRTGSLDDSDYFQWERRFLDHGVSSAEVRRKERETFLHLEAWDFPELIDIRPARGGTYIHSATEAFNEEGEREEAVIQNWVRHVGFSYVQLHASGHAPSGEVFSLVDRVGAAKVVPIHTEHPEEFNAKRKRKGWRLEVPVKGKPISVSG